MPQQKNCCECGISFLSKYNKDRCDECNKAKKKGNYYCSHGRNKDRCVEGDCHGSEMCEHKKHKQKCPICKPGMKEADTLNAHIKRFMANAKIRQTTKDYILKYSSAPDLETLRKHLSKNIDEKGLKIEECHLDHIKPKKCFDLSKESELLACCHYKNLQFIPAKENLKKGKKYTETTKEEDVKKVSPKKVSPIVSPKKKVSIVSPKKVSPIVSPKVYPKKATNTSHIDVAEYKKKLRVGKIKSQDVDELAEEFGLKMKLS